MERITALSGHRLHVFQAAVKWAAVVIMGTLLQSMLPAAESQVYPLEDISRAEQERLASHKPVVKVLDGLEEISLRAHNGRTARLLRQVRRLDPNFLAEAFFTMPVEPGTERQTLERVKWFLMDVSRFEEIPYYSRRHEGWSPLFEEVKITAFPINADGSEEIVARQQLLPFSPYTANYRFRLSDSSLIYSHWNKTALRYSIFRAVRPENMYVGLYVEAREGELFFHGIGGAKVFTFFGLFAGRLEPAFTGRVEAIYSWLYREFVFPRLLELRLQRGRRPELPDLPVPYNNPPELE